MRSLTWLLLLLVAALLVPATAHARKLDFKNCNATEKKEIKSAVSWLVDNFDAVSSKMGKNGLLKWPGKSKKKLRKKLTEKNLKFKCISEKKQCDPKVKGTTTTQLRGKAVPVLHQKRVSLCTHAITTKGDRVAVIIHELAHLVRINAHRTKCTKRCEQPRFSESVEQAAFWAYTGTAYSKSACSASCPK